MGTNTITQTGSGSGTTNSDPVRLNWRRQITSLSFSTSGSTTGFTAQYTLTPPSGYASASAWATGATWHSCEDIAAVTAATSEAIYAPVQGVRLQANASGTDTGTLRILQDGVR
jgi:hypothetical protein